MPENEASVANLKEMGFVANGKLSEGQGLIGVGQFAKSLEKGNTGRLLESEYGGSAGFIDNIFRMTKALAGRDTVSKEVRNFKSWLKNSKEQYRSQTESFLELDGKTQMERMAGGNAAIQGAVEVLFRTHTNIKDGNVADFKEQLGEVWQKADEWMNGKDIVTDQIDPTTGKPKVEHIKGQYEHDTELIDQYMRGAEKGKTETLNALWEMWDLQGKKDLVNRVAYDINSTDHNTARNASGKPLPLEGGLIRRGVAWLTGSVPREIGERVTSVAVGHRETRRLSAQGGLSELKHDALNRASAGSLERYEMFVRGVITKDELGSDAEGAKWSKILDNLEERENERVQNGGERDTRYLKRIAKLREGKGVSKATDAGKIAFYEKYYTFLESSAHQMYDSKKAEWGKYALKAEGGFSTGLLPAPLTEAAMKLAAMGVDGTLKVVKGVDGTVGLVVESMDKEIADWAIGRLAEATVGRELAATTYKNSENRESHSSAKVLRGAEAVWQRAALLAGRTADSIELSKMSPALLNVPRSMMVEGVDLVLGGVSTGKRASEIMTSLFERNNRLLSAKTLVQEERGSLNLEEKQSEYSVAKQQVEAELGEIFSGVPEQFRDWEKMKEWMVQRQFSFDLNVGTGVKGLLAKNKFTQWVNDLVDLEKMGIHFQGIELRKKVLEKVGSISDPDKYQGEWGRILNAGSARRTIAEVLGVEKHEGGRINRTENQIPLWDQMVIVKKRLMEGAEMLSEQEVSSPQGYDAVLENATLTELSEAQKRWLHIQKNRMERRSKLDDLWESLPKAIGATAGALVGTAAFQFLGNHFHEVATRLGIDLGEAQQQLQYAQEALQAAGDSANFVSPEYGQTHQQWAEQAGQFTVSVGERTVNELSQEMQVATLKKLVTYAGAIASGITTLVSTGYAGARLGMSAVTPFVDTTGGRMTGFVEEQPNIS